MMAAKKNRKGQSGIITWLADVPRKTWTILAIVAVVVLLAPFAWDLVKPQREASGTDVDLSKVVVIEDEADLLTPEEEVALRQQMERLTPYGAVAFITNPEGNYVGSTAQWAEQCYHRLFGNDAGVVFCIDMDYRYLYIFSGQGVHKIITESRADTITDNVYRYASRGEYYQCASEAFGQMATLLEGYDLPAPMKHISNSLLAVALSALLVFVIASLRTRMQSTDERAVLRDSASQYVGMHPYRTNLIKETRHVHVESSGGGGGGGGGGFSGGGGGGGGFSGGGGGHGF